MASTEFSQKYARVVDELDDAWAFVMSKIDVVGGDPSVSISPVWNFENDIDHPVRRFEVSVSGMTEVEESDGGL